VRSCSSTCRPTGGSFTPRSAVRPSAARRVDAVAGAERAVFALSRQYSGGCPVRSQSLYSLTLSQERCTVHHSCGRPILPNCLVQRKPLRETCALMQPRREGGKQRDRAKAKKKAKKRETNTRKEKPTRTQWPRSKFERRACRNEVMCNRVQGQQCFYRRAVNANRNGRRRPARMSQNKAMRVVNHAVSGPTSQRNQRQRCRRRGR